MTRLLLFISVIFLYSCNLKGQSDPQSKIDNLFNQATIYDSIGDYKNSISLYNQILANDSDYAGALVNRGRAFISMGDTAKGLNDLDKAIEYNPHERTYYARGTALLYLNKDLNKAEQDFLRAIVLNKSFTDTYYAMSLLQLVKGNLDQCELYLKEGERLGFNRVLSTQIRTELDKKKK